MSTVRARLRARAAGSGRRIVLSEWADPRVRAAAETLVREDLAVPVLLDDALLREHRDVLTAVHGDRRLARGQAPDPDALADPLLAAAL
ncbi:MAG: Phosphate acetyl/butaryl transferase, partial [Frankiales bacterium]|nr:Phosphate acetyl/butaryl transferase [Frankiales bacterium]